VVPKSDCKTQIGIKLDYFRIYSLKHSKIKLLRLLPSSVSCPFSIIKFLRPRLVQIHGRRISRYLLLFFKLIHLFDSEVLCVLANLASPRAALHEMKRYLLSIEQEVDFVEQDRHRHA